MPAVTASSHPMAALRSFTRKKSPPAERCELCGAVLPAQHEHLLEPASRKLSCSCTPCALLFASGAGRYCRVPRRIEALPNFQMSDAQWESLHLPISLAFFFHSSNAGRVIAMYPSPAGPTESLLSFDSWTDLVAANPALADLEPDVEALLVNRVADCRDYFRVPIDECFRLVGIIRMHWRGLAGGTEVWSHISHFSESLRQRSVPTSFPITDTVGGLSDHDSLASPRREEGTHA